MTDAEQIDDEKIDVALDEPSRYKIIFLNDDQTPMEWVVSVLREQYRYTLDQATELTMEIHNDGAAVVGTYSYEIAEQKAYETVAASRQHGFPLNLKVEEEG
jgi:ATP-dependent Clp protease adaptor protein ClpS